MKKVLFFIAIVLIALLLAAAFPVLRSIRDGKRIAVAGEATEAAQVSRQESDYFFRRFCGYDKTHQKSPLETDAEFRRRLEVELAATRTFYLPLEIGREVKYDFDAGALEVSGGETISSYAFEDELPMRGGLSILLAYPRDHFPGAAISVVNPNSLPARCFATGNASYNFENKLRLSIPVSRDDAKKHENGLMLVCGIQFPNPAARTVARLPGSERDLVSVIQVKIVSLHIIDVETHVEIGAGHFVETPQAAVATEAQFRKELHAVAQARIARDWKLPSTARFSTLQPTDDQWTVCHKIPNEGFWVVGGVLDANGAGMNRLPWKAICVVEDKNNVVVRFSQLGNRTMGDARLAPLAK